MSLFIEGVEIPETLYLNYINNSIGKIFKILPIFEECKLKSDNEKDLKPFYSYLNKITTMFIGSKFLFEEEGYIELVAILEGLANNKNITKEEVKSLVFHCIEILDKLKESKLNKKGV